VPVTLTVPATATTPGLGVTPYSLSFPAQGGNPVQAGTSYPNAPPQTLAISNIGGATLNWSVSVISAGWLSISQGAGLIAGSGSNAAATTATSVTVVASKNNLGPGTYYGSLTVTGVGSNPAQVIIPVTFTITSSPPVISAAPPALNFLAVLGTNPASQTATVLNTGGTTLGWSASASVTTPSGGNWLSVSPGSGSNAAGSGAAALTVSVNSAALVASTTPYTGIITISSAGVAAQTIPVNLTVSSAPVIHPSGPSLTFTVAQQGVNPGAQTFTLSNTGASPLNWTITPSTTSGGNWLTVTPPLSGALTPSNSTSISVSVNAAGLAPGSYAGSISISGPGAASQTVSVNLNVPSLQTNSPGFITFTGTGTASITISNVSAGSLSWSAAATSTGNWLSFSGSTSTSGSTTSTLTVNADASELGSGAYFGTITITSSGVANSPIVIPVALGLPDYGASNPQFVASPNPVNLSGLPAANLIGQFAVINVGSNPGSWSFTGTIPVAVLSSGTSFSSFPSGQTVWANFSTTNGGHVTVSGGTGVSNIPVNITTVQRPTISASPTSLTFNTAEGGSNPAAQTLTISNSGGSSLNWTAIAASTGGWLSVSPFSGAIAASGSATPSVSVNAVGLVAGTYTGTINVQDPNATNSPQTIAVTLIVAPPPVISLDQTSVSLTSAIGQGNPAATVTLSNTGGSTLNWTSTIGGANWLTLSSASGSLGAGNSIVLTLAANIANLSAGSYTGATITINAGALSSVINVSLVVSPQATIVITSASSAFTAVRRSKRFCNGATSWSACCRSHRTPGTS